MKQKQTLRPGKAMFRFSFLTIAFFSFVLLSCNNDAKKESAVNTTDTTRKEQEKGPSANAITAFKKFRILKSSLNLIQDRKLSLVPGFDDLADPTNMSLFYFPVSQIGSIGTAAKADDKSDGDAAPFDTHGIILSNNELVLANYDWPNIDYLVLEPTRDASHPDNLGYNIRAFRFGPSEGSPGVEIPIAAPEGRSTKPSPPAPPALYKK